MYDFQFETADKPTLYADLTAAARGLIHGESDGVANMANLASLLALALPDCNWTGFYRLIGDTMVLGPFAGKPACIRIPVGQGVCGAAAAAASGQTQLVRDVHAFPGHIACDAASASELVVPIVRDGKVIGVIDLDSPTLGRFDEEDARGIEALAAVIAEAV